MRALIILILLTNYMNGQIDFNSIDTVSNDNVKFMIYFQDTLYKNYNSKNNNTDIYKPILFIQKMDTFISSRYLLNKNESKLSNSYETKKLNKDSLYSNYLKNLSNLKYSYFGVQDSIKTLLDSLTNIKGYAWYYNLDFYIDDSFVCMPYIEEMSKSQYITRVKILNKKVVKSLNYLIFSSDTLMSAKTKLSISNSPVIISRHNFNAIYQKFLSNNLLIVVYSYYRVKYHNWPRFQIIKFNDDGTMDRINDIQEIKNILVDTDNVDLILKLKI